eukprot:scaffold28654_cov70-Phaeocystis_antarctica.AAC.1
MATAAPPVWSQHLDARDARARNDCHGRHRNVRRAAGSAGRGGAGQGGAGVVRRAAVPGSEASGGPCTGEPRGVGMRLEEYLAPLAGDSRHRGEEPFRVCGGSHEPIVRGGSVVKEQPVDGGARHALGQVRAGLRHRLHLVLRPVTS